MIRRTAQPSDTAVLRSRKPTPSRQPAAPARRPTPRPDPRPEPLVRYPDTRMLQQPAPPAAPPSPREPFGQKVAPASVIGRRSHIDVATRVFQLPDTPSEPTTCEHVVVVPQQQHQQHQQYQQQQPQQPQQQHQQPRRAAAPAQPEPVRPRRSTQQPAAAPLQLVPPPPVAPPAPRPAERPRGQIIVFFGCRGGTGSSLLAANLGVEFARAGLGSCLVDLDLQLGEALTVLGLEAGLPLSSLAGSSVDWEMVSQRLPRHPSGLCALSQTGNIEGLAQLEAGHIPSLLRNLARQFAVVVVDGIRDFNDHALAALDAADRVILVATQDVPAVRGAARRLSICRRLGYSADKFLLLLNRFDSRCHLTASMVAEEIGIAPSFTIANDFPLAERCINEGCTLRELKAQAEITKQIETVARLLVGLPANEKTSFWKRVLGKKQ